MTYFLEHIARYLLKCYSDRLEKQCIVFPNRRAGLYFMKHLTSAIDRPVWSPAVKTINELFSYISSLTAAENETLVFELYRAYRELNPETESFDNFYFWGEMILNDFDDVDKYLVDAGRIFTNLSDLRKIDSEFGDLTQEQIDIITRFWVNFNAGKITPEKKGFTGLWSLLPELYNKFRHNLYKKGIAYEGMIFREVAENCTDGRFPDLQWETFHFAGFNALNKCEKTLFKYLRSRGKARFYWDYDESYIHKSPGHSAGYFIRENLELFGNDMPEDWNYKTLLSLPSENVSRKIISTSSDIAQVKLVPKLLQEFKEINSKDAHQTAIILADENLLIPLLSSIPESVSGVNITMGYPLKFTQVYSFLKMLLSLQKNSRKENETLLFGYDNVSGLLQHSFLSNETKYHSREILTGIVTEGKRWIPAKKLSLNPALEMIFRKVESPAEIPSYIKNILEDLYITGEEENGTGTDSKLHNEFIFRSLQVVNRLEKIISDSEISMGVITWSKLFGRILREISVPFSGEPLSGIQIMGLLETRALDFRNIIILSVNEGILPRSSAGSSYIPYSLREAFGLPVIKHQDSIYSYYFYRLLHKAEKAIFIYNSNAEGLKTGEMSRLLMQLNYLSEIPPIVLNSGYEIAVRNPLPQEIKRTEHHQEILEKRYLGAHTNHISPRAVNTWLTCHMQFYYRYVCGIEEPGKIITRIDPVVFGSLLHQIMQKIYSGYVDKTLTKSDIEKLAGNKTEIEKTVNEVIIDKFHATSGDNLTGSEQIAANILSSYVRLILQKDANITPFTITGLEKELYFPMEIKCNGKQYVITLGGTIDRIDRVGGIYRILDYKTGDIPLKIKSVDSLFDEKNKNRSDEWLQILIYCEVFDGSSGFSAMPVIYSMRQINDPGFSGMLTIKETDQDIPITDYSDIRKEFSMLLRDTLVKIFKRDEPFRMTENTNTCRYCYCKELCNR
ncbi:MAG: PD-(D/E)XK nuclease family protein [Bacteroidales bacterium]